MQQAIVSCLIALSFTAGPATARQGAPDALERAAGWRALFDGESTAGWRAFGGETFPEQGWRVEEGCLRHVAGAGGGDLVTTAEYGDFELEFEWRVAPGGNSGVKYRVVESRGPIALEYQVLDDARHADAAAASRSSAALYDLVAPTAKPAAEADTWHRARIVARGGRVEHWLNGARVVHCDLNSAEFAERVAQSKFAGVDGFARAPRGRILLQDHGDDAWFRNLRIRDLETLPGEPVELFDGETLAGWREVGDAVWTVEDGTLLGEVGGGGQSFLVTERTFGDFLFEVDLALEGEGNSGIQIRSHQREDGRVFGYQIEIDPSERAWSGGLYDEARRGWLQNLEDDERARAALDRHGWNRYRIECIGPWIRTWVNGVPVVDRIDPLDLEGFLALQVHSGQGTRVRWKNFRLRDLGTRAWREVREGDLLASSAVRIRYGKGGFRMTTRDPDLLPVDGEGVELVSVSTASSEEPHELFFLQLGDRRVITHDGKLRQDLRHPCAPLPFTVEGTGVESIEFLDLSR